MDSNKKNTKKCKSVNVEAGTQYFCTCGKSNDAIFCDSTHGPENKPKRLHFEHNTNILFCMCRKSDNFPYCDGSHRC